MALSETATLIAQLKLEDQFSGTARKFNSTVTGMDQRTQRLGQLGEHIGQGVRSTIANVARIGVIAGGALAVNVKAGIDSLAELQRVEQLTATALKSTGNAAGGSAQQIRDRAVALEDLTTVDDKAIQNAENLLLTFRQIGPDAFDPTLKAAINLNAAMGGDENSLQGALIQVGKAVNDPIKGLTALRRVGVSFTEQQQDQIKKLVEAGKTMDAQRIILRELNKEFAGAGKAFGTGPAADMRRFGDAIEDAQQALATGFLPLIRDVSKQVQEALADPKVLANIRGLGEGLAGAVRNLIDIGTRLPWDAIGSAAKVMGEGAKALLQAFTSLPPWIQTAVLTGWGLNKLTGGALGNIFGDVIKLAFPKLDIFSRGGSPANPMWVQQVGGVGGGPGGLLSGGKGFWAGLGATFGLAAAAVIGEQIVTSTQTGFSNAIKVGNGELPTNVNGSNVGPTVQLNRDLFFAQGLLAQDLKAGLSLKDALARQPAELRSSLAAAIANNPLQQKALGLSQEQISWLNSIEGNVDRVKTAVNAEGLKQGQRDIAALNEAKANRLAVAHGATTTSAAIHTLEHRLINNPDFKPKIDSVAEFIRLLKRTSEFGRKGVGTTIEQGPKTGRDPVGDAFVALTSRLTKPALKSVEVQGEISRHIKALEEVQGRLLKAGNVAEAKHAQQNIDKLNKLIGAVDRHIPHFRDIANKQQQAKLSYDRGIQKTSGLLGQQLGTERDTARYTGIISRKNFSPRVAVTVNSTNNISVDDVIRSVTHTTTATGSGPGGPILTLNG